MSAKPKHDITPAEYLLLEDAAEFRSEYYNGEMFAMAGASIRHTDIKGNVEGTVHTQLKGSRCRVSSSDQRIKVPSTGLYTYPDIIIRCGPQEIDPASSITLLNPMVIIEVLSPSTERYDRNIKFRHYKSIATLMEYLLVAQDEPRIDWFTRQPDGAWLPQSAEGLDAIVTLTSVPVRLLLKDVYDGIDFTDPRLADADNPDAPSRRPG